MDRRRFLAAMGTSAGIAGCLRLSESDTGDTSSATTSTRTSTATRESTTTATTEEAPFAGVTCSEAAPLSVPSTDAWRQVQSDAASTGYVPEASVGESSACVAWRHESLGRVTDSVILSGANALVGGPEHQGLCAIDRATGERAWTTRTSLPADDLINVRGPIAVDDAVYVSAESMRTGSRVFALDAASGEERWRTAPVEEPDMLGRLRYRDGLVYGTARVETSTVVWAMDVAERSVRWRTTLSGSITPAFAVGPKRVYVAGSRRADAGVRALDAATGEVVWRAVDQEVRGAPAVGDGVVYATTPNDVGPKTLFALDAASGEVRWSFETLNGTNGSPVVADGTVTFGTSDGELYNLDESGESNWRYQNENARFSQASPVRVGDTILAGATLEASGLYAFDAASGDVRWSVSTPDVPIAVAAVDGIVYAMYRTGEEYTYNLMALRTS